MDLRGAEALRGVVNEVKPDVVVHSAAYRDPDFCEGHPEEAFRLNVAPIEQFCDRLPESVPLLFVSSDYVFDGPPHHMVRRMNEMPSMNTAG